MASTTVLAGIYSAPQKTDSIPQAQIVNTKLTKTEYSQKNRWGFQTPLLWGNIIGIGILHLLTLYGLLTFPYIYKLKTFFFGKLLYTLDQKYMGNFVT